MSSRIIICEASEIITNGLYEIINGMAGFAVVARLDTPEYLSEKILAADVNMVIINPNLLGFSDKGLPGQLLKDYPNLILVALVTNYIEPATLKSYHGVIEINDSKLKVINKMSQLAHDNDRQEKAEDIDLSKRETDVLVAVAKGLMNKEIADAMNISIHTVISHRKNITRKTGIKSVSGLTVYALINNLIDESEVYK